MRFAFLCKESSGGGRGRVAIVGAGPAGLAAAGYLVCQGYEVDVYDKLPAAGGMMMFVIPPYRIPRENIVEGVEDLEKKFSVKFYYRTKVYCGSTPRHEEGDEFVEKVVDLKNLINEYDAVLISTGTWLSRKMGVPGEDAKNVMPALEFIYRWWIYEQGLTSEKPPIGRRVVVIGGGLSAVDAAEVAMLKGAQEVYLVYRRTIREAPAGEYEIRRLVREGINWIELAAPTKVIAENGVAKAIEFVKMRLGEPDESGRPRPIPIPGSEFQIEADLIVAAIGEIPTPPLEAECDGIKTDKRGRIIVNERFQTGIEKVFAAGDVVTGPSMVGKAFGSGLRAARSLDLYLRSRRAA